MNAGEHVTGRGQQVHDEQEAISALTQLRSKLSGGLVKLRLNKTQLATRARLGRTTVSEAFRDGGPVPSEHTVGALAAALKLPTDELLELRQSAARATGGAAASAHGLGPGRPIGQCEPRTPEARQAERAAAEAARARAAERWLAQLHAVCSLGRTPSSEPSGWGRVLPDLARQALPEGTSPAVSEQVSA
uniref:helix-turn-helix domain-containing protein n=1 Tax=Streptomyces chartreusis TaxID=1969 RepID=UPI003F496BF9